MIHYKIEDGQILEMDVRGSLKENLADVAMLANGIYSMLAKSRPDVAEDFYSIPAADVAPVVHARWVSFLDGDHIMPERYYRCSRCGRVESRRQPYCHCGAKMDGGDTDAAN